MNYNVTINLRPTAEELTPVLQKVSATLRKYLAEEEPTNCLTHCLLGQDLLRRQGISVAIHIGWCAWRVSDNDYVCTHPFLCDVTNTPEGIEAIEGLYHAWNVFEDCIIDFSTYQIAEKIKIVNAANGSRMQATWHPDYLLLPFDQVVNFRAICTSRQVGQSYYQRLTRLEARCKSEALPLPQSESENVWMLYQNPDLQVIRAN
jgi:hypothetical protein